MSLLTDRLLTAMKMGAIIGGLYFGENAQATPTPTHNPASITQAINNNDYSSLIKSTNLEDREALQGVIGMMGETKTGAELLDFLSANGTKMSFDAPKNDNAKASFSEETNSIQIRRENVKNADLSFLWILSHECEHARHCGLEKWLGYNLNSSLDDGYISTTIHESLAERTACCISLEYMEKHPETRVYLAENIDKEDPSMTRLTKAINSDLYTMDGEHQKGTPISELAQGVFDRRMSLKETPNRDTGWQIYEKNALKSSNDSVSKTMEDWNKIVSDISMRQVTEIKDLPIVSSSFVRKCISSEIAKNPNVNSLKELDLSCAEQNKKLIQLDKKDAYEAVIATMFEAQAKDEEAPMQIPDKLQGQINNYLGVELSDNLKSNMGTFDCSHDKEYMEKMDIAKKNLEKYSPKECLETFSSIFNTPENKAFVESRGKDSDLYQFAKTATFMKEFFYPNASAQVTSVREPTAAQNPYIVKETSAVHAPTPSPTKTAPIRPQKTM